MSLCYTGTRGKTPEHNQAKHTKHPHSLEWHNSTGDSLSQHTSQYSCSNDETQRHNPEAKHNSKTASQHATKHHDQQNQWNKQHHPYVYVCMYMYMYTYMQHYTRIGSNKGKPPEHNQAKHTKHPHSLEWHNSTITIAFPIYHHRACLRRKLYER